MAVAAGSDRRTVETDGLPAGSGHRMVVAERRVAGSDRHMEADSTIRIGVGSRACRAASLGMVAIAMEMASRTGVRGVAGVRLMSR
jgi:hypothetical protein